MLLVVDTGTLAAIYTQNFLDLKPAKYDISNFIRIAITSTYLKFGQSCAIGKICHQDMSPFLNPIFLIFL